MSVAFRRESDEEHLEPKFEIPIPPGPNLVTQRGLALTQARVDALETALTTIDDPAALERTKRDLRYWRTRLATAELAPPADGDAVAFGTRVTIRLNGKQRIVEIVGDDEAEPANDRLSFSAPLSRAIMEAEVGERLEFGGKADAIEIVRIEAIAD